MDELPLATRRVVVRQTHGLHMRPAELVARTANEYAAKVTLVSESHSADAKSILELIGLAAEQGTELTIEARGADAEAAVSRLADLFENDFPNQSNAAADEPA